MFNLREAPTPALLDAARVAGRVLREGGAIDTAWYVTEPSPNNFPGLPVRQGVQVLVGVALFPTPAAYEEFLRGGRWEPDAGTRLRPHLAAEAHAVRLTPTARSALRGGR